VTLISLLLVSTFTRIVIWNMERVKTTKTVDREIFQQIRNSVVIFK